MSSILGELKRNPQEMFEEMANSHAQLLEAKLEEILSERGLKLGVDGVDLVVITPPDDPQSRSIHVIYEIRKNGVMLDTFGWEIDLTGGFYKKPFLL
jgi:hypothetical protein